MSTTVRLEINVEGFNEYRNSPEVVALLEEQAAVINDRATAATTTHQDDAAPFRTYTVNAPTRAVTYVHTNSIDGILAEARDRALTKAVG